MAAAVGRVASLGQYGPMAIMTPCLSPLGFGAFKIGRNIGAKYRDGFEVPEESTAARLLNDILDIGINFIDTAPAYGLSEERIGRAIGHRRSEYILSTKVGEFFENGISRHDFSRAAVNASIEGSLCRLCTDVLDIVFIHSSKDDHHVVTQTEVVPALLSLRNKGLVKRIGLSGYTVEGIEATFSWADAMMVEYHPERTELTEVMEEGKKRGLTVVVKKALASGILRATEGIEFALSNQHVDSVIVGSLNLEHMRENWMVANELRGNQAH